MFILIIPVSLLALYVATSVGYNYGCKRTRIQADDDMRRAVNDATRSAYDEGYSQGYDTGHKQGKAQGFDDGRRYEAATGYNQQVIEADIERLKQQGALS